MNLVITVKEIIGNCPAYKVGDRIILEEGYKINLSQSSTTICMHSLSSLMPYYVALSEGILPQHLGLAKEGDKAYIQCLDPCKYTGGGTVIFEVQAKRV